MTKRKELARREKIEGRSEVRECPPLFPFTPIYFAISRRAPSGRAIRDEAGEKR